MKPEVIEDAYGQELCVEARGTPMGRHVWLSRPVFSSVLLARGAKYFSALTPDQARNLAKQLEKAAEEAER